MTDKTLDCSDLDRHMGKPIDPGRLNEPLANNDIRRWVQAMHYPNRVHYEDEFAAQSRFGRIVAPQSFAVATDDGHGTAPACVGFIPNSHLIFGGDEWWFHGPRIYGGDLIHNERVPLDYVVKETKFAGPTCFQRGDNRYYNAQGDLIATQRSTSIRYRADLAREMGSLDATEDPEWTDEQLAKLEDEKVRLHQDAARSRPRQALLGRCHGRRQAADPCLRTRTALRASPPNGVPTCSPSGAA